MTGYIECSLGEGETIVRKAQFHWWYTLKTILWACTIVGLVVAIPMMLRRWTTELAITTHRFVEKNGLLTLTTNEIALQNIEGVRVTQSLWGRILDYGHLRIEGTGIDAVEIPDIADPVGFRAAIETAKGGLPPKR
jgi:uncharacterized membrane protein YdbT with pleckstrin-like domain